MQFPKFQGHRLVLFEVILTGVEEQFLSIFHELNIYWIKNRKRFLKKNTDEN